MAYLGVVGISSNNATIAWSRYVIASTLIGEIIGQYSTYGGYIYVG